MWSASGQFDFQYQVFFEQKVKPSVIEIHETLAAPFVKGVAWGANGSSLQPIPGVIDNTKCPDYFRLQCLPFPDFEVDTLNISIQAQGYAEVDSVRLQGIKEGVYRFVESATD